MKTTLAWRGRARREACGCKFSQAQDYLAVVEHYDRAFRAYPRCALVDVWVAGHVLRNISDFWRWSSMIGRLTESPLTV